VLYRHSEVRRVSVDGIEVLVCGNGGRAGWERALSDVALGCQRILGTAHTLHTS
jgi:hypothetical protein